jgi:hypothetical protein
MMMERADGMATRERERERERASDVKIYYDI